MVDYKINTASQNDILEHLRNCDHLFSPPLSERIILKDYSEKLFDKSEKFEAWENGHMVGLVAAYFNNKETKNAFITSVSVLESYSKQGIASKLIEMLLSYAKQKSFISISLEVYYGNNKAILLYTKKEFQVIDKKNNNLHMKYIIKNN